MMWRFWVLARTAYLGLVGGPSLFDAAVNIAIRPAFTMLTFGYLVSTVASGETLRNAVIGAGVLTLNWPTLGGSLQTVGYELGNGTLGITLASPVSRARLLASRGLIHVPNGLLAFSSAALIGTLVFDLGLSGTNWLGLFGCIAAIALSLTALGLLLGVGSLVLREVWALLGVASVTLYILSGAIVPLENLNPPARAIAAVVPMRWGVEGLHRALNGDDLGAIVPYWIAELGVASAFFGIAVLALRAYEYRAVHKGSVDLL